MIESGNQSVRQASKPASVRPLLPAMKLSIPCLILATCLVMLSVHAQIPPQPGNPNTVPPRPQTTRPFARPGTAVPAPGIPGAPGQPKPAGADAPPAMKPEDAIKPSGGVELQFPNTALSQILLVYEDLTGLKIIRDANAEQATVSIETTGELTKEKAIMFIEKSLLLNGYSFVPSGEGMVKLLSFDAKKPQIEGVPLIESAMELPETDQVVSYVALLQYLSGEDAIKAIDQVIPRHSYGVITAVPNSKALVITENSNTIRAILALMERLDNKPAQTITKSFQLTRSDAEDVKGALEEILGTDEKKGGSSSGGGAASRPSTPTQPGQPNVPGGVPQQPAISVSSPGGAQSEATPPKIIAIERTNKIMVIATPEMVDTIGKLIEELDGAAELRNFVSRTLKYLGVEAAMGIIGDAITRGSGEGAGGGGNLLSGGGTSANNQNTGTNNSRTTGGFNNGMNSGLGGNSMGGGFGSSGMGGGFGSGGYGMGGSSFGGGGGGANMQSLRPNNGPRSLVIGKTLLISDPTANSIFASGPPENLRILNEVLDELDERPQQILISVVIGELQLDSSRGLSVDSILRGALMTNNQGSAVAGILRGGNAPLLDARDIKTMAGFGTTIANGLTFYGGFRDGLDFIIKTLETGGNFQVISRPTLFTMNNMQASITSGVSIPVATSTQGLVGGGATSTGLLSNVQYQPVVLRLDILPLINSDDELTLQIAQENNEASEDRTEIAGNEYPELSQQTLNTTVMVKNQSTVLLGGLIRESKNKSRSGLPFLSRIPVLGAIVGSQSKSVTRRELLIFIQPRIVNGMHDLPPSYQDSPGTSPFADTTRAILNQEKPYGYDPKYGPPVTERRRSLIWSKLKRLFSTYPPMDESGPPPSPSAPDALR